MEGRRARAAEGRGALNDTPEAAAPRIAALDLIRGVAVMGILAINIAGFAGPPADVYDPVSHGSPPTLDAAVYACWLVLFEGKMRALFAILFGASMELFIVRAEARGRDGAALQLRRLGWLAVIGYLHWLLWWGDILASYALAGGAALALRRAPSRSLLVSAAFVFALAQAQAALDWLPLTVAETRVAERSATPAQVSAIAKARRIEAATAARDLAGAREALVTQARDKLAHDPSAPAREAFAEIGEALPYMLLGIVLLRTGFFAGAWPRRPMRRFAIALLLTGGASTLLFARWALAHGFPFAAMRLAIGGGLAPLHATMAMGYAALLVLAAPALLRTAIGRRIAAAGRMALSNYLGTTIGMTAVFYGWGFALIGTVGSAAQAAFVLVGIAAMLGWSAPWLARFRQGPFEWLWRSLVEGHAMPFKT